MMEMFEQKPFVLFGELYDMRKIWYSGHFEIRRVEELSLKEHPVKTFILLGCCLSIPMAIGKASI